MTAASEDLQQVVVAFTRQAKLDLNGLEKHWEAELKRLENLTRTSIKSATTRLRAPIDGEVQELEAKLDGLHERIPDLHRQLDKTIETLSDKWDGLTQREHAYITRRSYQSQWNGVWIALAILFGVAIGVVGTLLSQGF